MEWSWPAWAKAILEWLGGSVRTAVKAQEVIEDHPKLREEFEAHTDQDAERFAQLNERLALMHGDVRAIATDVSWLKRAHKE